MFFKLATFREKFLSSSGKCFLRVKSRIYICVEFGPVRTHKDVFGGRLELRTLMDSVW